MEVAKAGWLLKRSGILKRWKKYWFALTIDGYFRCFESPDDLIAKQTLIMSSEVVSISIGGDVEGVPPPETHRSEDLIKINAATARNDSWILCADNLDDMLAWQLALEQARLMERQQIGGSGGIGGGAQSAAFFEQRQLPDEVYDIIENNPNNGYPMYYRGTNYYGNYPSRVLQTPRGPVTVVYVDAPVSTFGPGLYGNRGYYNRRRGERYGRHPGRNVALGGAVAGGVIASTLFLPFWMPMFWF